MLDNDDAAAAAVPAAVPAAAAADDDDNDAAAADDDVHVYGDHVKFLMPSINMLSMILMSEMITTAITHMPALAFSRLPLQEWIHPPTQVCLWRSYRSCKILGRV